MKYKSKKLQRKTSVPINYNVNHYCIVFSPSPFFPKLLKSTRTMTDNNEIITFRDRMGQYCAAAGSFENYVADGLQRQQAEIV